MCRHEIAEVFPRQKDLPKNATEKERIDLFVKMFRQPTDLVICQKCGKVGHYIKSNRGGVRWHQTENSTNIKSTIELALDCWKLVGKSPPNLTLMQF